MSTDHTELMVGPRSDGTRGAARYGFSTTLIAPSSFFWNIE